MSEYLKVADQLGSGTEAHSPRDEPRGEGQQEQSGYGQDADDVAAAAERAPHEGHYADVGDEEGEEGDVEEEEGVAGEYGNPETLRTGYRAAEETARVEEGEGALQSQDKDHRDECKQPHCTWDGVRSLCAVYVHSIITSTCQSCLVSMKS